MYTQYDIDRIRESAREYKSVRKSFFDKEDEVKKHWYLILIGAILIPALFVGHHFGAKIDSWWPAALGHLLGIIGLLMVFKFSGLWDYWSAKSRKRQLEKYIADDVTTVFVDREEGS